MNIALFGGTFDPIHIGHLQAAKAAAGNFALDQVLFIPTGNPPHKHRPQLTAFPHRFAMVALACTGDSRFVPSTLEMPTPGGRPHYSVQTARKARGLLARGATLFFLLGADAFLDLPQWKDYRQLLDLVNFIVVSRPGSEEGDIPRIVPGDLLRSSHNSAGRNTIMLRHSTLNILRGAEVAVASRDIRQAIRAGRGVAGLVPPLVEQYILKAGLYRPRRDRGRRQR